MNVENAELYGKDQIVLFLNSSATDTKCLDYGRYFECQVSEPQVFPFYEQMEMQFGIKLMPVVYETSALTS